MKMHNHPPRTARTLRQLALLVLGGVAVLIATSAQAAGWMDISGALLERLTNSGAKPAWPGGCSGVVANRETGAIIIKVVGCGLWRSSDQGVTWERIDEDHVSGRDETGWATSADQNTPTRMASFSLDGLAGWTTDGRQTRIPGFFRGTHYLGGAAGLLVSKDKGASWRSQGAVVNVWQGPFFGNDEREILVHPESVYLSYPVSLYLDS